MNEEFGTMVLSLYANHCMMWRREIVSFNSNAENINQRLLSLESVIEAFDLGLPKIGAVEDEAAAEPEPQPGLELEPDSLEAADTGEISEDQVRSNETAISNAKAIAEVQEMVQEPSADSEADAAEPESKEFRKPVPRPAEPELVPRPANSDVEIESETIEYSEVIEY